MTATADSETDVVIPVALTVVADDSEGEAAEVVVTTTEGSDLPNFVQCPSSP